MFGNRPANTPALIGLIVALWLGSATVSAQIWPVPPGLNPGDQYRLVFVTDGTHAATSGAIADYNTFVTNQAKLKDPYNGLKTEWKAIASAQDSGVNARANTSTRTLALDGTADPSVPIYNLSGNLVASGYSDLWDGTIGAPISVTQSGVTVTAISPSTKVFVWTGTNSSGAKQSTLGGGGANVGDALSKTSGPNGWIYDEASASQGTDNLYRLYAMSDVLTYSVPEPSTLGLGLVLALAGAAWCNRRRKREQERSTNPAQS